MKYVKDGQKREEFWPRQDLAGDAAGQEQASRVARSAMLRIALGKVTDDRVLICDLMRVWSGERPKNVESDVFGFLWKKVGGENGKLGFMAPRKFPQLSTKESELLGELRQMYLKALK
jgi:hypothetical protein